MKTFILNNRFLKIITISFFIFFQASAKYQVNLVHDRGNEVELTFTMSDNDYKITSIEINGEKCDLILLQDAAYDQEEGFPGVPHVSQSIIIPDLPKMRLEVVDVQYKDVAVNTIAPSKGSFSRNINPADVPYVFGETYKRDGWFPSQCAKLGAPFIVRDFRANVVCFLPFIYNAKTKTLRINTSITVKVSSTAETGINCKYRTKPVKICPNFEQIYSRRFINYPTQQRYTPVDEEGTMLIISPASYIETMKPFADWKNRRGITTEIVDIATVGTSASAITTYVANYYKNNDLKYLLLVGDNDQVVSSTSKTDPSDNKYGCIEGSDSYVEVFVGRFSGTTADHIKTQADKVLYYERKLKTSDTWLCNGVGTASGTETDDINCINHIITDMKSFTYATVNMYQNSSDNSKVVADVNKGLSYHPNSSHGTKTSLNNLSVSDVSNMTNANKYPYNYTLACDPGSFTSGSDCLGEALLKKSGGGYIGAFMASISQPWYEPYAALKEQADILTEKYPTNFKRTYGGIAHNGCMKMIDDYASQGPWVSDCWVLFGDPSLLIYTATPKTITISHPTDIGSGAQQVKVTGTDSATVCLYSKPQNIQQVKKLIGGSATFSIQVTTKDSIYITATKFNHETYEGVIKVALGPYIALTAPQTGDIFWAGDEVTIKWDTGGGANVSQVKLDYSTDNGTIFTNIVASITNTGSHKWTVPDINESDQCIIKITDLNGNLQDESGHFSIKQKAHIGLDQTSFDVELKPNTSTDKKLTTSNTGKGKLTFSIKVTGVSKILINELYVSGTAFYDGFELWNQGSDIDISGWKLQWNDNQSSSGSYTFPAGFTFKAGKTILFVDQQNMANDSTIYSGINLSWDRANTEFSIAIIDKNNKGVDFVRTSANSDAPPAGTNWNGTGILLSSDYVFRTRNLDSDDATDWSSGASGTPHKINAGQTLSTGGWLSVSPDSGTVNPLSAVELTVTFNAAGLAQGTYYDTISVFHNDPDLSSPIIVPCKLFVDPNVAISVNNQEYSHTFSVRHTPGKGNGGVVHFTINAPSAKKSLKIFDCLGNLVYEDNEGEIEPWYLRNQQGTKVASGIYFVILELKYRNKTIQLHKTILGVK